MVDSVNNRPPDRSFAIISWLAERYNRLKLIDMKNLRVTYDGLFENQIALEVLRNLARDLVIEVFNSEDATMMLVDRVSVVQNRDDWARRIVFNTLSSAGFADPTVNDAVTEGIETAACQEAFARHYRGFLLFAGYPTAVADFQNFITVAVIFLTDTVHIEQVQSKRQGSPGGWELIRVLHRRLVRWAQDHGIRFIRATATNERALLLFQQNGFVEVKPDFLQDTLRFQRHLVFAVPTKAA